MFVCPGLRTLAVTSIFLYPSQIQSLFNFFWFFLNFKKTIEFHQNSLHLCPYFGNVNSLFPQFIEWHW